jgi:hypothetical protein
VATKGTPNQGRDQIIAPRVYTGLTLILYTNTADSLTDSTLYSNLTQPTGTGYAAVSLSGVWSSADGIVSYDHGTPDDVIFENTHASANWSAPVVGAAIIGGAGPYLLHFMDAPEAPITMTPGQKFRVDLSTLVAP